MIEMTSGIDTAPSDRIEVAGPEGERQEHGHGQWAFDGVDRQFGAAVFEQQLSASTTRCERRTPRVAHGYGTKPPSPSRDQVTDEYTFGAKPYTV